MVAAAGKVEHERFTDEVERLFAQFSDAAPPLDAGPAISAASCATTAAPSRRM